MSERAVEADRFYEDIEHWVVLGVAVFTTCCFSGNFSILELLKAPVRGTGKVSGGTAVLEVPKWFPAQDAVLDAGGGAIYSKLRDLPVATRKEEAGPQTVRLHIDLSAAALPAGADAVSLTYFPWFRFVSEPINFDAVGRVADYIANCFRFLLVRQGISATVEGSGETRQVRAAGGLDIEIVGTQALRSIALTHGPMRTMFDLAARTIEIDGRMFPAAFAAGQELLKTADRIAKADIAIDGSHLRLSVAGSGAHV